MHGNDEIKRLVKYKKVHKKKGLHMISQFYAVTGYKKDSESVASLYRISDTPLDGLGPTTGEKLALRGHSNFVVGYKFGSEMLAICDRIVAFVPDPNEKIIPPKLQTDDDGYLHWGGATSSVIALFQEEDLARLCLVEEDHQPHDKRWREETKKVIRAIGENHPNFYVSTHLKYWLFS